MKLVRVTIMYAGKPVDSYVEQADIDEDFIIESARGDVSVVIEEILDENTK